MINKCLRDSVNPWNLGLETACNEGHKNVALLMYNIGMKNDSLSNTNINLFIEKFLL